MRLKEYGKLLDKVIPFEARYICADEQFIYLFKKRPHCKEVTKKTHQWLGAGGELPLMIMRRDAEKTFPDLEEYFDITGELDYLLCVETID